MTESTAASEPRIGEREALEFARRLNGGTLPEGFEREFAVGREARERRERPRLYQSLTTETPEETEQRRTAAAEARRARRQRLTEQLRTKVPQRFLARQFRWDGNAAWPAIQEWSDDLIAGTASNLLLYGASVGVGKSHALWDIALRAADSGLWVVGWSMPDLNRAMRPDGDPETLADALECDLLVVDEMGAEHRTSWTQEQWYAIVNHRWGAERPIAMSSNLTPEQLDDWYGAAVRDRLVDDALMIEMAGQSRRGITA
jgi:DNA replication protein DnaC